jgi:hypothetical protein
LDGYEEFEEFLRQKQKSYKPKPGFSRMCKREMLRRRKSNPKALYPIV